MRDVTPCSLVELYQTSEIPAAGIPETLVISKQTVSTRLSIDCNITGSSWPSLSNSIGLWHHTWVKFLDLMVCCVYCVTDKITRSCRITRLDAWVWSLFTYAVFGRGLRFEFSTGYWITSRVIPIVRGEIFPTSKYTYIDNEGVTYSESLGFILSHRLLLVLRFYWLRLRGFSL